MYSTGLKVFLQPCVASLLDTKKNAGLMHLSVGFTFQTWKLPPSLKRSYTRVA